MAAPPIQQSLPIRIGFEYSRPYLPFLSSGDMGCVAAYICTLGPIMVRSPMLTDGREDGLISMEKVMMVNA